MHQQCVIWVLLLVCLTWWMLSRGKAGPRRPSSLAGWHLRGLNCGILCKMEHPFLSSKGSRALGSSGATSCPLEGEESVSTLSGGPRGLGTHSGGGCPPTADRELLPPLAARASPHCSCGAGEQLASSLHMMAQLPCTCSSQRMRSLGGGLPSALATQGLQALSLSIAILSN